MCELDSSGKGRGPLTGSSKHGNDSLPAKRSGVLSLNEQITAS
jgi:hypothetical protein